MYCKLDIFSYIIRSAKQLSMFAENKNVVYFDYSTFLNLIIINPLCDRQYMYVSIIFRITHIDWDDLGTLNEVSVYFCTLCASTITNSSQTDHQT